MEIKQITKNKFKISLKNEDLQRYHMNFDSFMSIKIYKNPIVLDLLNFLDKANIILIDKKSIFIDTFLLNNNIIFIFINFVRFF